MGYLLQGVDSMVNRSMGIEGRRSYPSTGDVEGVTDLDLGMTILSSFIYLFPFQAPLPSFPPFPYVEVLLFHQPPLNYGVLRKYQTDGIEVMISWHCVAPGNAYLVALTTSSAEEYFKLAITTINIEVRDN